ncbi:hypothetical protein C7S18_10430 [Ahniella affigens]|uniref:IPTL-CTERM protein sorting domain-containing protein n=1 Tax=Ahniella affigens TaxID=2021234 RepID=A0A2P1PRV6_9GAMM|nr:hypothetical protein C7S18_10430 [Ahniella affigens]
MIDEVALKAQERVTPPTVVRGGNSASYVTDNTGGPEWPRPFADGTCCSGLGPVRYTVQPFSLSANDTCDISSVQAGFDGYIFVYQDAFDPLNQTVNFVAGDDDGNGGIGTSDIMGLALTGNRTYYFVSTGFELGDEGSFSNSITCPSANVFLNAAAGVSRSVPSNSQWSLALLAAITVLAGFLAMVKRSR